MEFTFGISNYFVFSFRLQFGSPPQSHANEEQSQQRASEADITPTKTIPVTEQLEPSSTDLAVTVTQQQLKSSTSPSLQSLLDTQLYPSCTAIKHSDGNHVTPAVGAPVLQIPSAVQTPRPSRSTRTSTPQTPQPTIRTAPHHLRKTRRQTTFLTPYAITQHLRPLQPSELKVPPKEPSSKLPPSRPSLDTSSTPCSNATSFQTLPLEIRHMIYQELLVSIGPIRKPHKLVCNKRSIMVDSMQPVKDIDSSILRVCRTVYLEAMPVLYGKNTFEFSKPRKLRDFSHAGLDRNEPTEDAGTDISPFVPEISFRDAPAGRFTLIRSIILRLGHDRKPYIFMRPGAQPPPDRKRIWSNWYQYFFSDNEPQSYLDWGMYSSSTNRFPALDKVVLDFTDWQLSDADAIRAESFVNKLARSRKLSVVTIKGMKNAVNLEEFRKGLLKPGGVFVVKD